MGTLLFWLVTSSLFVGACEWERCRETGERFLPISPKTPYLPNPFTRLEEIQQKKPDSWVDTAIDEGVYAMPRNGFDDAVDRWADSQGSTQGWEAEPRESRSNQRSNRDRIEVESRSNQPSNQDRIEVESTGWFDVEQQPTDNEWACFYDCVNGDGLSPTGNPIIYQMWGLKPGNSRRFMAARERRDMYAKRIGNGETA